MAIIDRIIYGSEGIHKILCHVRKQLIVSVDLLIISELISVVALAFTTGTGDLIGGGGAAASQPVKVAPAVLSYGNSHI